MSEPSEEQIRAFEEQLKQLRVEDVLVQTLVTFVNLGARRLGLTGEAEAQDLGQAQLAIEGARALMPLIPEGELGPIRDALSQLQVAFAQLMQGGEEVPAGGQEDPAGGPAGGAPAPGDAAQQPQQPEDEAERAKARAKIWTPPGS